jgi:hypothetical protein
MNQQVFNFNETTLDGITYYIIPKNTLLYHGSNTISSPDDLEKGRHTFFALTNEYASKYAKETGNVLVFQPTEDLRLIAMDKDNTKLYKNAPAYIQKIMDEQYGFHNNHKRKSDPIEDNVVSKYLCTNNYEGYAANKMKGLTSFEDLDSELIICDKDKLRFVELIQNKIDNEPPRVERKKRQMETNNYRAPPTPLFNKTSKKNGLFDEEDEEDEKPRGPGLFGYDEEDEKPRGPGLFGYDDDDDDEDEDNKIGGKKKQNISNVYKKTMKRPVRAEDGTYTVKGKKYKELFGSREQVYNGTAYKTKAGLTIDDILMNKWGRLVSAKKHATAKKEMRLEKYGYSAKKGKFGYVKKNKTRKQKKD